ncbi:MAG: transcriptional regulator [Bacteroidetes bacterium 24-39-8]|jgi:ATP-dependent DNA helicase RecG|nr:MAG: transcriptional regulator [Sphingobacteriia bacterium 35-40-8]OYZ47772.1 MAG: transcriptional regulator [Bacteroidetes bacterium 24-39-8]OZA66988.1 MAG: transcriptional regulator [Sphingobacteriia bacterium 39-39-8]HQS04282.1 ATP-binding protein [Daejeonella sp.]
MPEQQNIEYKQSWHDDYLKWICGFANAQGGIIFIGKDDNGKVVGVDNYKKLMEDLPNKIRNTMGISAEVNLHEEKGKYFVEIITHPFSVPISVRGRYYYRSGSTKQELTGASLNEFLLKKSGKTWDDVIEPRASFADIDEKTVATFLKASEKAGRLPEYDGLGLTELFEKLRLTENSQLKRAAIILFGKAPAKFYPNTFVKIGRFGKDDADIKFQETEEGNLIELLQAVLNQLNHKFLTRPIDFEGMHRIEKGEYPVPAIREMLLNALVHRNYMGAPIQIRVYNDKISIWNEGSLPEGLTLAALKRSHSSRPRNPIIADVSFKGGYIDAWGRGTIKILDTCKQADLPEPEMKELDGGFIITLFKDNLTEEQLIKRGLNDRQLIAVQYIKQNAEITNGIYQKVNNIGKTTATEDLQLMVELGVVIRKGNIGRGTKYVLK